jgi:SagB-type dehydrogenase family enzyme
MKNLVLKSQLLWLIPLVLVACTSSVNDSNTTVLTKTDDAQLTYILPSPNTTGTMSVEEALFIRRSYRNFEDKALSAEQLSQILWAAYGITKPREDNPDAPPNRPSFRGGFRTAPSAGATFPFEIYAIVGNVDGIEPGVYKYSSEKHKIVRVIDADVREELTEAALGQQMVKQAPATIFYSAIFSRATARYGDRGRERYVCMDLGHSAQNIYLQAEALGLGTCAIGAFTDSKVSRVLQLPAEEEPLYMMPIGYRVKNVHP